MDYIVNPPSSSCPTPSSSGASTSSALIYDGLNLSCIGAVSGSTLNAVLTALNTNICNINTSTTTINNNITNIQNDITNINNTIAALDSDDITITGVTWSCITPAGSSLSQALQAIQDELCSISTAVTDIYNMPISTGGFLPSEPPITGGWAPPIHKPWLEKGTVKDLGSFGTSNFQNGSVDYTEGWTKDSYGYAQWEESGTLSFNANKQYYVWNESQVGIQSVEQNIGDAAPVFTDSQVALYKFTTDASAFPTLDEDLRETGKYDESVFRSTTDVSGLIPNGTITPGKLNLTSTISYTALHTISNPTDLVHKSYVDTAISGISTSPWTVLPLSAGIYHNTSPVGIGTATPDVSATLHVQGTFMFVDGNQGAGKYLVSDANGFSSWTTLTKDILISDEGVSVGAFTRLNFIGSGVVATDAGGGIIDITITGSVSNFTDLADVDIVSATINQGLRYNGVEWENTDILKIDATGIAIGNPTTIDADLHLNSVSALAVKIETAAGLAGTIANTGEFVYEKQFTYTYTNGGASPLGAGKVLTSNASGQATWESILSSDTLSDILNNGTSTGSNWIDVVANYGMQNYASATDYSRFQLDASKATIDSFNGKIEVFRTGTILLTSTSAFNVNTSTFTIQSSNPSYAGAQYASDYSANFTARTLVDKGYVDNAISGVSGISAVVDDTTPQLGGTLDANTFDIDMGVNIITDTKVGQWDLAYGWGDHSTAGYALVGSYNSGYIPRWNATLNTLESGSIRDNGLGTIGLDGTAPVAGTVIYASTSKQVGLQINNSSTTSIASGAVFRLTGISSVSTTSINGIVVNIGNAYGVANANIGTLSSLTGSLTGVTNKQFGIYSVVSIDSSSDNVGGYFEVSNGGSGNAYSLKLVDGLQGTGKVLTSDANGNASWQTPSGGSSGVLGISDASGTYTYYSDFATAIAAASSGDTIEMFADIEETTNTTVTLIDNITINGNGHTYTLNVDDTADAFTFSVTNGTAYFNNIKVLRTGRATGTASGAIGNFVNNTIKCQGAVFISDYGRGFRGDQGNIHNAHIISVEHGVYAPFSSKNLYNCHIEVSSTSARGTYLSGGEVNNCYVKAVSMAISVSAGQVYNSTGISTNSYGIFAVNIYDSIGKSTSSIGIGGQIASNCVGISSTDFGTNVGSSRNCTFISVSGSGAYRGSHQNATIISSSNYGINEPVQLDNCYVESSSNRVCSLRDNSEIRNSNLYCKWNSTTGECITSLVARTNPILTNTTIKVTNSGAYGINMYIGSTLRYANNSFQGTTIPINTTTTTQGIVNTSDSQGNILV